MDLLDTKFGSNIHTFISWILSISGNHEILLQFYMDILIRAWNEVRKEGPAVFFCLIISDDKLSSWPVSIYPRLWMLKLSSNSGL